MLLNELFHMREAKPPGSTAHANSTTGFYGAWGAGCIFMARSTGRFLLDHRSDNPPPQDVEQPGTWGTWGGAGVGPATNALVVNRIRLEVLEETGHDLHNINAKFIPLYIFKKNTFQYFNFLVIVDEEFEPHLNWESQGFRWCEFGNWPSPLHFGLKAVLADPHSIQTMRQAAEEASRTGKEQSSRKKQ